MLITVFLIVLVVALVLGNAFLALTKPKELDELRHLVEGSALGSEFGNPTSETEPVYVS